MESSPRAPAPPPRADRRPHWRVTRRFDGTRPTAEAIRGLLAAHSS